jgi:hypothetical protein
MGYGTATGENDDHHLAEMRSDRAQPHRLPLQRQRLLTASANPSPTISFAQRRTGFRVDTRLGNQKYRRLCGDTRSCFFLNCRATLDMVVWVNSFSHSPRSDWREFGVIVADTDVVLDISRKPQAMRLQIFPLFILTVCLLAAQRPAFAQENKAESARTFLVTIVEARLVEQDMASNATADRLWAALRDSAKTDWLETVQCTVLEGQKTRLMFGRQVPVVMGITESAHGKTRNMVDKPLTTEIFLGVTAADEKLGLEIEYQSSRLSGENNGELPPPEIERSQYTSSIVLRAGKPKLLALTPNSILMILIELDAN